MMDRLFYSYGAPCQLNCKYCFAASECYSRRYPFDFHVATNEPSIVYPICDSDISVLNDDFDRFLSFLELESHSNIISISSKGYVSNKLLNRLATLNERMLSTGGFVKFSVSISNKSRIIEFEPNATPYSDRISLLEKLNDIRIPTSLNIKPILPFIGSDEYLSIVEDVSGLIDNILIGDLYVFPSDRFFEDYIRGKYQIVKKQVPWIKEGTEWMVVRSEEQRDAIMKTAEIHNINIFESDDMLLLHMVNTLRKGTIL